MIRCAHAASGAALLLLLAATSSRADCFDWSDGAGAMIEQGVLRGLPPGPLHWRIGRSPAGGIHQSTAVEVTWTAPDGQSWRQALFEEIQDGRPALRSRRGMLDMRVTYCERGGACRNVTLTYAWDRTARRFVGTRPAARESVAATCASSPEPIMHPIPAEAGAP